jgi:hypothetical protein
MEGGEIEPLEKERQVPQPDLHHLLSGFRPAEPFLLQPLLKKAEPVPLPIEDLYGRSTSIAEDEKMS